MSGPAEESQRPVELRSATALLHLLRERKLGAVELLDLLLARIERLNPRLNAVVARDIDGARRQARAADDLPAERAARLHGLPMTIKDAWEVVGMTASCGMPELAQHRPTQDADAVARLRSPVRFRSARPTRPSLAADHQSYNAALRHDQQPLGPDAHARRFLGRRRRRGRRGIHAARTRQRYRRVDPLSGAFLRHLRPQAQLRHRAAARAHSAGAGAFIAPPLGVAGPMARSPKDLELALDVLASPAEMRPQAWSLRLRPVAGRQLARVPRRAMGRSECLQRRRPLRRCDAGLRAGLAPCRRARSMRPRGRRSTSRRATICMSRCFRAISTGMPEELLVATERAAREYGGGPRRYPERIARAVRLGYAAVRTAARATAAADARWRGFFDRYDLILCPIMPTVAFPHDHSGRRPGHIAQYARTRGSTASRSVSQRPAVAGPCDRRESPGDRDADRPAHRRLADGRAGDRARTSRTARRCGSPNSSSRRSAASRRRPVCEADQRRR